MAGSAIDATYCLRPDLVWDRGSSSQWSPVSFPETIAFAAVLSGTTSGGVLIHSGRYNLPAKAAPASLRPL